MLSLSCMTSCPNSCMGEAIATSERLTKGLKIAFLMDSVKWDEAKAACTKLGYGHWEGPKSINEHAFPQAPGPGSSAEGIAKYLKGPQAYFWSSSADSDGTLNAWVVNLALGNTNNNYTSNKTNTYRVLCARP